MIQFLSPGIGNNGFSWPKKPDRKPLQITPLRDGHLSDLKVGEHVAFQDFDTSFAPQSGASEYRWVECRGLSTAIRCLDYKIPIYVFDNHNHVFYAWCEALKNGWIQKGAKLVHMDAHFDAAEPPSNDVNIDDLTDVERYTHEVLQIATYIKPALKLGIFSEVINAVESQHFQSGRNPIWASAQSHLRSPSGVSSLVLNLDLDIFSDEMSHIGYQEKLGFIQHLFPHIKLITMATSPFFIDQERAITLAAKIVSSLPLQK